MASSSSSTSSSSSYACMRHALHQGGDAVQDARVEVNQRALIDKILARYASAGAVYRELLQNSNDAGANTAELRFTTTTTTTTTRSKGGASGGASNASDSSTALATTTTTTTSSTNSNSHSSNGVMVTQVDYRNNGAVFGPKDWARLRKIAEGNPDPAKVGAFGVGAYTMFSIAEEPMVVSGNSCLLFFWKGDSLWTKTAPRQDQNKSKEDDPWTTFYLPSRDVYPLPDLAELGEFLAASLTFTTALQRITVLVDNVQRLDIHKSTLVPPRPVLMNYNGNNGNDSSSSSTALSWFKSSSTTTTTASPQGLFKLSSTKEGGGMQESVVQVQVTLDGYAATTQARFLTATCTTHLGKALVNRMERVTKKLPPKQLQISLFLNYDYQEESGNGNDHDHKAKKRNKKDKRNPALRVTQSLAPPAGEGRIFIGFRTSQTTGLAAHVAAPFLPTVEREAMDLQDAALRVYNLELLLMAGMLLRLALDHAFTLVDTAWQESAAERQALQEAEDAKRTTAADKQKALSRASSTAGSTDDAEEDGDEEDEDTATTVTNSSSLSKVGSLFGFARFMARGVQKRIVSAVKTASEFLDDGSDLLRPLDGRPLVTVEQQAIALMQAYCPRRSTPDPTVGTALAEGFSQCTTVPPPVLTVTGVVRSDWARLPALGMQQFCTTNVIRQVVYENCTEYHDYIANCRKLDVSDLLEYVAQHVLEEEMAFKLLQWWRPFYRASNHAVRQKGAHLKELLRFYPKDQEQQKLLETSNGAGGGNGDAKKNKTDTVASSRQVIALRNWLFYLEKDSLLSRPTDSNIELPLPETVIPAVYQDKIGLTTLTDSAMQDWFEPLPMEIWTEFIAHQPCLTKAAAADAALRHQVLVTLFQEYRQRGATERQVFGSFCHSLLHDKPCLPFDDMATTPDSKSEKSAATTSELKKAESAVPLAADVPSSLYLYSAELKAFEGVGSFRKVAASLKKAGITEDFLLDLGVRKSVSIDFLFSNLDTLQWSNDPRPMVEYLRQATLTASDRQKLVQTRYLPAEKDTNTYAPSELFLPSEDLRIFPFCKILQWPTESEVSERSENGVFLVKLGMQTLPKLSQILEYMTEAKLDDVQRRKCLEYVSNRLNPRGVYYADYSRMGFSQRKRYRFLPCSIHEPMEGKSDRKELLSPVSCYSEDACSVMGFPVVDPALGESGKLYGSLFQCAPEPESRILLRQLLQLVDTAKSKQKTINEPEEYVALAESIETCFTAVFKYLSHRSSDFDVSELNELHSQSFIPCRVNKNSVVWFKPNHVFFRQDQGRRDTMTEELFQVIEFSPFLAAAGVKQEATTRELFQLLLDSPKAVLQSLGSEKKYRALLRRIAAQPPFANVTPNIRKSPFLMAYTASDKASEQGKAGETLKYELAAAEDIYIIDNSFFGRMFPVKRAPHESDLEDFYAILGSRYISKSVERRFEHVGKALESTALTNALRDRIMERAPLLLSPHVTTRPMVEDAVSLLESKNLDFFQASSLMAVYSLRGVTRRTQTTCFSRKVGRISLKRNAIYVVENFDWFDVGYAIGDLILQRCQLEDAFFISSLLDAPLEQLRSRGFPVDRILQPQPLVEPEPTFVPKSPVPTPTVAKVPPKAQPSVSANQSTAAAAKAATPGPIAPPIGDSSDKGPNASASTSKPEAKKLEPESSTGGGMEEIIFQMFPDADKDFVRGVLGKNPSLDDVQSLAESMAQNGYPQSGDDGAFDTASTITGSSVPPTSPTDGGKKGKKRGGLRSKLGKAFGGLRGSNFGGASVPTPPMPSPPIIPPTAGASSPSSGGGMAGPSTSTTRQEETGPVSPASDATSQTALERMLQQQVSQSAKVNSNNIESPETVLTSVPQELDRGETCEVIDGQNLRQFTEYRNGTTASGIRVFASQRDAQSGPFLSQQTGAIEAFSAVLTQLAHVYDLPLHSIAIFYEPSGKTIAFNRGRSVYYNLRFFYALHYRNGKFPPSADCYSYWFITTAHELSHNLVSAHNKEHGFYTESYASLYLPKLAVLIAGLAQNN